MAITPPSINISNNVNSKIEINIAGDYKLDSDILKIASSRATTKSHSIVKPKILYPQIEYTIDKRPNSDEASKRNA